MVSLRKLVMAMVLLVIVAGAALAAITPPVVQPIVSCQPYNQQTARLRSEGVTELIPALTFVCMVARQLPNILSGDVVSSGTLYDWFVYFPAIAPLTSSPYGVPGGPTEPQLYVEVIPQDVPGGPESSEGVSSPYWASAITPGNGASGGSVEFDKVNMNPHGDSDPDPTVKFDNVYITIVNLRVDALGLASSGALMTPNALTLTIFAQPSYTTVGNNQQNPGNVFLPPINGVQQYTLSISVGYSAPSLVVSEKGSFNWRQCVSWSNTFGNVEAAVAAKLSAGWGDTGYNNLQAFAVDFTELYSYAFAPPTDGWEDPEYGGIRLAFVFSTDGNNAWPSFVELAVPVAVAVWDSSLGTIVEANLVTGTNPDGSGGTVHWYTGGSWTSDSDLFGSNAAPGTYFSDDYVDITGSTMVVYQIAVVPPARPAVITTLEVPVFGAIWATPTIYPPPDDSSAQVTITYAGYAPWTPASVPQESPIPRFHGPTPFAGSNLLVIDPCTTNLLFPYLVAGQGWDTGVAVSNSGFDPFWWGYSGVNWYDATGTNPADAPAVPGNTGDYNNQPGVCLFYFYGSFGRGAPLVTESTNPPNPIIMGAAGFGSGSGTGDDPGDYIQPGTTSEDLISAVLHLYYPAWNETTMGTWNGYAIAQCDFLYAHGYAFAIYQGSKGSNTGAISLGYLALVFDQRGIAHPSQTPEQVTF